MVGVDRSHDDQPVFDFVVLDRVATHHYHTGLPGHFRPTPEDLSQYRVRDLVLGETGYVERRRGAGAHGVEVAERVRRRDPPEIERVIDDRREKIHRQDERTVIRDAIYPGVVRCCVSHQEVRIHLFGKSLQHLAQTLRAELRRSTGARGVIRQADVLPSRQATTSSPAVNSFIF